MLIRFNELIGQWVESEGAKFTTSEIVINTDKITSMKEDTLCGRGCVSIILDHNLIYVDHTIEGILSCIPVTT